MTSVLIHPLAGALSAYGIGLADVIAMREAAVEAPLTAALAASLRGEAFRPMEESARAELSAQGVPSAAPEGIGATRRVHLRYEGTDTPGSRHRNAAARRRRPGWLWQRAAYHRLVATTSAVRADGTGRACFPRTGRTRSNVHGRAGSAAARALAVIGSLGNVEHDPVRTH
jgi:5-oxoprolinase (ATP-hydrolysing)